MASLVPKAKELRLLPVGRLDRDSSGLMILTNDNDWIHPLTHPSFSHKKRYEVVAKGLPTEDELLLLRSGVILDGETKVCQPCQVNIIDQDVRGNLSLIDITVVESKPRQIERMLKSINCEFVSLKRTEFGPIKLKGLRKGQWREMTSSEIMNLKKSCAGQSASTARLPQRADDVLSSSGRGEERSAKDSETLERLRKKNISKRSDKKSSPPGRINRVISSAVESNRRESEGDGNDRKSRSTSRSVGKSR